MRKSVGVRAFDKTVSEHYANLCNQENSQVMPIGNPLNVISSVGGQTDITIPPYNIETWDFMGNENTRQVSEDIFSYFKNSKALPLAFLSCYYDDTSQKICQDIHAIALVGVKKVTCDNGVVHYTGIYKNSWGEIEDNWDLEEMIKGMIKHQMGYATIHFCKDSECLNPPILPKPDSKVVYHLASMGDVEGISKLGKLGLEMNRAGTDGWTPLNIAATNGHLKVVEFLVLNNADKDMANSDGYTPLIVAATNGHLKVVEFLVEKRADINKTNSDGYTPLNVAASNGYLEIVKFLVEKGADKDKTDHDGLTPLNSAATKGLLKVVEFLVEKGADKDKTDHDGFTPLNNATANGHLEVVKFLVENKVNIDKPNNEGLTPLAQAVFYGKLEVVKFLVNQKADPLTTTKQEYGGKSILDLAKHPENRINLEILNIINKYILEYNKPPSNP